MDVNQWLGRFPLRCGLLRPPLFFSQSTSFLLLLCIALGFGCARWPRFCGGWLQCLCSASWRMRPKGAPLFAVAGMVMLVLLWSKWQDVNLACKFLKQVGEINEGLLALSFRLAECTKYPCKPERNHPVKQPRFLLNAKVLAVFLLRRRLHCSQRKCKRRWSLCASLA